MSDMLNNELCAAVYLPSGERDVDRFDFESFEAAEEYVFRRMCKHCKEERMFALQGEEDCSEFPGCYHEWIILKTEDYDNANGIDDLFKAAGWREVWKRDETRS